MQTATMEKLLIPEKADLKTKKYTQITRDKYDIL